MKVIGYILQLKRLILLLVIGCSLTATVMHGKATFSSRGSLRSILLPQEDLKLGVSTEGIVDKYLVEEGDFVEEGQLVFQLVTHEEFLRLKQAQTALANANAEFEFANKSLARVQALSAENISSEKEIEQAEFDARNAEGRRDQALVAVELAEAMMEKKRIRSPIAGVFLKKYKNRGEAVRELETVARILDVSKLKMVVYAGSEHWGKFKSGDPAVIEITSEPFAGVRAEGVVTFADSVIDPAAGTFRVKVLVEPKENIVVGLSSLLVLE